MKRILVVDDDRFFLTMLAEVFASHYLVETARSAEEAIALLKDADVAGEGTAKTFDLIITDFNMPGLSGLEFAEYVKSKIRSTRFTPLIMLTQHEITREQARQHGCASTLPKSDIARVISIVSILLSSPVA